MNRVLKLLAAVLPLCLIGLAAVEFYVRLDAEITERQTEEALENLLDHFLD